MQQDDYGIVARVGELVAQRGGAARLRTAPRGRVRTLHAGGYASTFRGRGMEFDETRIYQPGDDVRAIDWRVTARTGRAHTKLFHEERERPVLLLVDQRPQMRFGTRDAFKSVVAARAAATIAWAARDGGDRVGGVILTDRPLDQSITPPQRSRARLLQFLHALSDATSRERAVAGNELPPPSLVDALSLLARTSRPGTLLYVISDFAELDAAPGDGRAPHGAPEQTGRAAMLPGENPAQQPPLALSRQLARLARRCEVACVLVYDGLEAEAPPPGRYRMSDGARVLELPAGNRRWRDAYAARFAARRERLEALCRERGMAFFPLATGADCATVLRVERSARALRAPHHHRAAAPGGTR